MNAFVPDAASTQASQVDARFFGLLILAFLITLLVFALVITFSIRYRRGAPAKRAELPEVLSREWEVGWTAATLLLFVFIFWWAASADLSVVMPPANSLEIHVRAKQWMWEAQHPTGARELDELHVPIDTPVLLSLESQDVIHSFFIPAFRIKQDVLPGRDAPTQTWFQATKLGTYRLLCAEYCGTNHSAMRGKVVVMRKDDYADWASRQPQGDNLAHLGAALFVSRGCAGCHAASAKVHAPSLAGIYGRQVALAGGRTVVADEAYLRDSILQPARDIVAGYEPIMPSFKDILDDGEIQALTAYIRSLSAGGNANP